MTTTAPASPSAPEQKKTERWMLASLIITVMGVIPWCALVFISAMVADSPSYIEQTPEFLLYLRVYGLWAWILVPIIVVPAMLLLYRMGRFRLTRMVSLVAPVTLLLDITFFVVSATF